MIETAVGLEQPQHKQLSGSQWLRLTDSTAVLIMADSLSVRNAHEPMSSNLPCPYGPFGCEGVSWNSPPASDQCCSGQQGVDFDDLRVGEVAWNPPTNNRWVY